jgi:hypothetical protein
VTLSILLSLALLPPPSSPSHGALPGVVEPRSGAWAVVHAGQLWVCWRASPDCWRRVELDEDSFPRLDVELDESIDDEPNADTLDAWEWDPTSSLGLPGEFGPERWRLGFDAAAHLWIERDDQRWRVEHGQPRARMADDVTPVRLARPRNHDCGPDGLRPAISGGRLGWEAAPRCAEPPVGSTCVVPPASTRPRKPVPIRLHAGLQLGVVRDWTAIDTYPSTPTVASVRPSAGFELLFVIQLGFDPTRTNADARARAALLRHDRVRHVPPPKPGPLAAAEQAALIAAVCGGQP